MVNQSYIDDELTRNPSVSELAILADLLEAHAEDCYSLAVVADSKGDADACRQMYDAAQDALDTAGAIYLIVYEAASYIAPPDEMSDADRAM